MTHKPQDLQNPNLQFSPIGLGAWQIGDSLFWSYGKTHKYEDSYDAFVESINRGVNFIDTAEFYGFGSSERILGEFLKKLGVKPNISTKYFPYPWRLTRQNVVSALKSSLRRLRLEYVDLYQIHWPIPPLMIDTWAEGLVDAVQSGLTKYVGLSNFTHNQIEKMHTLLQANEIPLVSNQVEYNLLNRKVEKNGLVSLCKDLGITVIAYSPLAQGYLTGKYDQKRPSTGLRTLKYATLKMEGVRALVDVMRQVGRKYGNKSPSQIAINWLICKDVVPIPGAKNGRQAIENVGAVGWRLNDEDIKILEESSDSINNN